MKKPDCLHRPAWTALLVIGAIGWPLLAEGLAGAEAPPGRYTVTDTTVLDTKTGLTWQRVASSTSFTWDTAKSYCATVTGLPGAGWRLPTMKELATLLDLTKPAPTFYIDLTVFNMPTNYVNTDGVFWTATPYAGPPQLNWNGNAGAWNVYFKGGVTYYNQTVVGAWARCVR